MRLWKLLKSITLLWMLCILPIILCGCQKEEAGDVYRIYYVNPEETGIIYKEYRTETVSKELLIEELLIQLETIPEKLEYKAPITGNVNLKEYSISEDQLILNFDEKYRQQPVTTEILVRAATVRTLTQIKGIDYVSFQVNSEPFTDASGAVVGVMNADMFIDNAGNEINTYEKVKLALFFTDESGESLRKVTRTVVYSSNIPMERLVVEQLIAGPKETESLYPTINPDTKIVSVNVKDGICYVNFDATYMIPINNVLPDVSVYSITNSLVELPNINKVQISINGETDLNYKEGASFSSVFERNLELVE